MVVTIVYLAMGSMGSLDWMSSSMALTRSMASSTVGFSTIISHTHLECQTQETSDQPHPIDRELMRG